MQEREMILKKITKWCISLIACLAPLPFWVRMGTSPFYRDPFHHPSLSGSRLAFTRSRGSPLPRDEVSVSDY
jgi:hypothetical protein